MKLSFKCAIASALLCMFTAPLHAWEPNASDLDAAIKTGDFAGYLANATAWLSQKVPARPSDNELGALLKDPQFLATLDQRQLIAKVGADKLGAFARADASNKEFLGWLLKDTPAMELYLEGAVPLGLAAREENKYTLPTTTLDIWNRIIKADPDAKSGLYLKLAIATALVPPGSINIGAGGAAKPADSVERYKYYKTAHQNKELFPSFDRQTVWEYTHIVSSGASNDDLTWARDMVNTFRPDLRADEMVVNSTSLVWRRNSPFPYDNCFKNVLAGGGKCGPRSSWSVMVCQAFGIPAIGVGQPGHACVAFKAANPMAQPQPGSAWKVAFGAGWQVSKLIGLSGKDFLAAVEDRAHKAEFSRVEHYRWLAAATTPPDRAAAIMEVAHAIQKSLPQLKTDITASLKPEEAEADPGKGGATNVAAPKDTAKAGSANTTAVTPVAGVLHIEAASFVKTGGKNSWGGQIPHVLVHASYKGGKQVYFQQQMKEQWADYKVEVPAAGTYEIVMKAACINNDQVLEVLKGDSKLATVPIPLTHGLWQETKPVELKLEKGPQVLRIQTPTTEHMRGIALHSFELKAK